MGVVIEVTDGITCVSCDCHMFRIPTYDEVTRDQPSASEVGADVTLY